MRGLTRDGTSNEILIVRITVVEVTAAVARRRKGRTLTSRQASSILSRFRKHLAGRYTVVEITPGLLDAATKLADTHELRAYDAVQLAVAIELKTQLIDAGIPIVLMSADEELNVAAKAEGLLVENPLDHP